MTSRKRHSVRHKFSGLSTESKLFFLGISTIIPIGILLLMLWANPDYSLAGKAAVTGLCMLWAVLVAFSIRARFTFQLRTLNTLIEALRTEDYSLRSSGSHETGDLAELYQQINSLTGQLQKSRQDEQALRHLLERIIGRINVAIIACDHDDRIVLANHQMGRLLGRDEKQLEGMSLADTAIRALLPDKESRVVEFTFAGASGRWQIHKNSFVQDGKKGTLVFITDLEQVLSEEEIKAWQRLIRVIAHEVNNSLTPINSLCQTMKTLLSREAGEQSQATLLESLDVINERALNLNQFIGDYARIARVPEADKTTFKLKGVIKRIISIFSDENVHLAGSIPDVALYGDPAQIEQLLINLVKNAVEANQDRAKPVEISVTSGQGNCLISIRDEGKGILNKNNLFVPFYTTKQQGAGIGLALCRRIATAHQGEIQLDNRDDGAGAVATVKLPLALSY